MRLRIENGRVFHGGELRELDVLVDGGVVEQVGGVTEKADDTVDASGCWVLPGAVDVHVHFREPGATHKEDWRTGSMSAAAGGVTTVVDQPNTSPPTVTGDAFDTKRRFAEEKSVVDFGINAGVTPDWEPDELFERPVSAFGEIFMADSTGEMGVPIELFGDALGEIQGRGELATVHAEDSDLFVNVEGDDADAWSRHRPPEAEVSAVESAVETAERPLHFAHISHPRSVEIIADTRHTCEVTPHHLYLSRDDLGELGTLGRMNPPLRSEEARRELWDSLDDVDAVATDHAPHTLDEKDASIWDAPSGVPGVETMVPLLLGSVVNGELELGRVVELVSSSPADIFGFGSKGGIEEGNDADIVVVEPVVEEITADRLHSKAGWTPFEGFEGVFPDVVVSGGEVVYERGEFVGGTGELVY